MRRHGFSLIELLTVVAIIAILAVFAIPAFTAMGKSSALNSTSQSLVGLWDLARQTAVTQNRPVEVRFYKLPGAGSPTGSPESYRGAQIFLIDSASTNAVSRATLFSNPVVLTESVVTSSMMDEINLPEQSAVPSAKLPEIGVNYRFRSFRFMPDGGTDLPMDGRWFVSLVVSNDPVVANGLPANFVTLQLDPRTGRSRVFRP